MGLRLGRKGISLMLSPGKAPAFSQSVRHPITDQMTTCCLLTMPKSIETQVNSANQHQNNEKEEDLKDLNKDTSHFE